MFTNTSKQRKLFVLAAILQFFVLVLWTAIFCKARNYKISENIIGRAQRQEFENFMKDWCRLRKARVDLQRYVGIYVYMISLSRRGTFDVG